jgi:predicted lipoprotein with Yx(FWY)xxD motif
MSQNPNLAKEEKNPMRKHLFAAIMLLVLLASACSPQSVPVTSPTQGATTEAPLTQEATQAATTEPTQAATEAPTAAATEAPATQGPVKGLSATVSTATVEGLGTILVDHNGMPLYMYKGDKQNGNSSACTGDCLSTWAPLPTTEAPQAGEGVDGSMLGSFTRPSSMIQATYNGWPLYHYLPDSLLRGAQRGQPSGQGLEGKWFVMGADGNPVTALLPTATAPAATGTTAP